MQLRFWHKLSTAEIFSDLQTGSQGLTTLEAKKRLVDNGTNELITEGKRSVLSIFLSQFNDLMIWVLIGAAIISG